MESCKPGVIQLFDRESLWIVVDEDLSQPFSVYVRVITGVKGEGHGSIHRSER